MKKIILLGVLFGLSIGVFGERKYVGPGQTYTTIEDAANAATSGDEIYILNGTYTPTSTIIIANSKELTFRGESASGVIVSGSNAGGIGVPGRIFSVRGGSLPWLPGSAIHLNRLTITDAYTTGSGAAIEFQSGSTTNSTIDSVIFTNCSADIDGGAICADTKLPTITECIFYENSAGANGGAVCYALSASSNNSNITNCTFYNNSSTNEGSALAILQNFNKTITINNSTFGEHNSSPGKAAIFLNCNAEGAKLEIKNSTIANNLDGGLQIQKDTYSPTINIYNDIFDNNTIDITSSDTVSTSAEGCIIETFFNVSLAAADNIIGVHPKELVSSTLLNHSQFTKTYALTSYGVAIAVDAASPSYSSSIAQNGVTRTTPDIGAYEFDETLIYRWKGTGNSTWSDGTNWSTGTPPPSMTRPEYVIIENCSSNAVTPSSSSDFIVPSKLIIRDDGALDLSGSAYVFVDTLFILSNENEEDILTGQLKAQIGNFNIVGETHIQQFLSGGQWNFLSSISGTGIPVQNLVPEQTFSSDDTDESGDYWVAKYDQEERATNGDTDDAWVYVNSGTTLGAGSGYIVWADRDMRAVFNTYDPNNDKSINLTYTNSVLEDKEKGWNLVGNPFICPIDWDEFTNPSDKIDEAIYYFDKKYQTYFTYVSGVYDPTSGKGLVPAAQSFFVKTNTNGASLTFTTAMQTINSTSTFYKAQSMEVNELVKLSIHSTDTVFYDETYFRHKDLASKSYDGKYDGYKFFTLNSIVPQLYSSYMDEDFSINTLNMEESNENIFPLSYKNLMLDSVYKIAFTQKANELGLSYVLEDTELGVSYMLTDGDTIEIIPTVKNSNTRFVLKSYQLIVDKPDKINGKVFAYSQLGKILVSFEGGTLYSGDIYLYDISGKLVNRDKLSGFTGNYEFANLKSGIYIVRFEGENNHLTEKLIVRQ